MEHPVYRVPGPIRPDADWDKDAWRAAPPLVLRNIMGPRPAFFPHVEARISYDDEAIYVIFRVRDQYVRAVKRELHGPVCNDSCVEFFFTPAPDTSRGYFNVETVARLRNMYSEEGFAVNQTFDNDLLMIIMTFGLFLREFDMPDR